MKKMDSVFFYYLADFHPGMGGDVLCRPNYGGVAYPFGIICSEGIFADVTGTGAAFWVYYGPRE